MSQETLEKTKEEITAEEKAAEETLRADDTSQQQNEEEVTATPNEEPEEIDFFSMPDDEFEKAEEPVTQPASQEKEEEQPTETATQEKTPEEAKSEQPAEEVKDPTVAPNKSAAESTKDSKKEKPASKPEAKKQDEPTEKSTEQVDKVAAYDRLMAPFKANGRDVQVKNVDEALRLMQMGAGHIKYQNEVRPAVALKATLDQNRISPERLNFLIEVSNGNKDAIAKLVRDSGIDPYEISTDDAAKQADKEYRPKNYSVSDEAVSLAQTVQLLQASDPGKELLGHVRSDVWDDKSRKMLQEDPSILSSLGSHKEYGVYDIVTTEVERQRTLGGLTGMSFLEAYHKVATELDANGAFKQPGPGNEAGAQSETGTKPSVKSEIIEKKTVPPKPAADSDPSGVAPVKPGAPVKAPTEDVMNMSDDEFMKRFG